MNNNRSRRRVADFNRHLPPPFRFEWCHVYNDSAPRVCTLSKAHRENAAWDLEILNRLSERKSMWWYDTRVALVVFKNVKPMNVFGINRS